MLAAFTYCKMELKRALRIFPVFMAGAVVLAVLLGTIAFLAGKVLYGEATTGRVETGVVLPENDLVARQAVHMLSSMESVESICDFQYMEEVEGRKKLKDGEISALLIIPENFIQSILNGTNTPVPVILPENPGIEARIFREMTEAGTRTLKTAQAAIYATDHWLMECGLEDQIPKAEDGLNRLYLKYSLDREIYFKNRVVSASGRMSSGEHFGICFFVLFLILGGIPLSGFFRSGKPVFYQKLKMAGMGDGICAGGEVIALSVLYGLAISLMAACAWIVLPGSREYLKELSLTAVWGIFLTAMAACGMVTAVYELCGNRMTGMMTLFWGSILMMFLAGGILPPAFLPESLRKIGACLPTAYMISGVEKAVFSGWELADSGRMAGIILISWGGAVLGRRIHG